MNIIEELKGIEEILDHSNEIVGAHVEMISRDSKGEHRELVTREKYFKFLMDMARENLIEMIEELEESPQTAATESEEKVVQKAVESLAKLELLDLVSRATDASNEIMSSFEKYEFTIGEARELMNGYVIGLDNIIQKDPSSFNRLFQSKKTLVMEIPSSLRIGIETLLNTDFTKMIVCFPYCSGEHV